MSIRSIFRRKATPPAETWEAGDLAECVASGVWMRNGIEPSSTGPAHGERFVVDYVGAGKLAPVLLGFERFAPRTYDASAFRKVRPQADEPVAADAQWVGALLWQPSQPVHGEAA